MESVLIVVLGALSLVGIGTIALDKLFHLDVFRSGWRKAKRELPEFAAVHDLEYKPSVAKHEMGSASGQLHGRKVRILPDERARLEVSLRAPDIQLATYKPQIAPPENMQAFDTGRSGFDRFFRTRYATREMAEKVGSHKALIELVENRLRKWTFAIRYLEIAPRVMRCSVIYGQSRYIPEDILEKLLPELCELARLIDEMNDD